MATTKYAQYFLRLDNTLIELPSNTPSLTTKPKATALQNAGNIALLRNKIHRRHILIIARKDKIRRSVIDFNRPTSAIVRHLCANRWRLGRVNLLGNLILRILQERKECVLSNLTTHLFAKPSLTVTNCIIKNLILKSLKLSQQFSGGRCGIVIIWKIQRHAELTI